MTIQAKIIADSISPNNIRLITMQLRYPKFIHSEFMTHRVLSRNASSSRAIPTTRLIQDVIDDPAMPVFWGKNRPGMQASEELLPGDARDAKQQWLLACDDAISRARKLYDLGAHKQIVNRVIEPYTHINVVVTSTNWANFYALRRHKDAQPEMKALADAMWEAQQASEPKELFPGEWHLPYVEQNELTAFGPVQTRLRGESGLGIWKHEELSEIAIRLSVARCARVSYLTHEGKPPNIEEDLKLYDRLMGSEPLHASPAEHQATPDTKCLTGVWENLYEHGNFTGWRQFRKMLSNECVRDNSG